MHLRPLAIAFSAALTSALAAADANPFLKTLAETSGGVVIAYGTEANSLSAAQTIRSAIRAIPGQESWDRLVKAADLDTRSNSAAGSIIAAGSHIIAVGRLADNVVLQGNGWLPTWWMDRTWYLNHYTHPLKPADLLSYQASSGFIVGGYGEWPDSEARVGLIEVDRSPYFVEWLVHKRWENAAGGPITDDNHQKWNDLKTVTSPAYPKDVALKLLVRISGSGGAGVQAAAIAFANAKMLNGVVFGSGAAAGSGPAMFTLPTGRYLSACPFTPPAGANGWTYLGWIEADAFQYDGFVHDAQVAPQLMVRLKYLGPNGITGFPATPHRRGGFLEVCALRFVSDADATTALANLLAAQANSTPGKAGRITGFNSARVGRYVYVESLPEPAGASLIDACKTIAAW